MTSNRRWKVTLDYNDDQSVTYVFKTSALAWKFSNQVCEARDINYVTVHPITENTSVEDAVKDCIEFIDIGNGCEPITGYEGDSIGKQIETEEFINEIRNLKFVVGSNKTGEVRDICGLRMALKKFCIKDEIQYIRIDNNFVERFFEKNFIKQLHTTVFTVNIIVTDNCDRNLIIQTRDGLNGALSYAGNLYKTGRSVHVSIGHQGVFTLGNFFNELSKLTENIIDTDNGDEIHFL